MLTDLWAEAATLTHQQGYTAVLFKIEGEALDAFFH
jgi:hypothetical protein